MSFPEELDQSHYLALLKLGWGYKRLGHLCSSTSPPRSLPHPSQVGVGLKHRDSRSWPYIHLKDVTFSFPLVTLTLHHILDSFLSQRIGASLHALGFHPLSSGLRWWKHNRWVWQVSPVQWSMNHLGSTKPLVRPGGRSSWTRPFPINKFHVSASERYEHKYSYISHMHFCKLYRHYLFLTLALAGGGCHHPWGFLRCIPNYKADRAEICHSL